MNLAGHIEDILTGKKEADNTLQQEINNATGGGQLGTLLFALTRYATDLGRAVGYTPPGKTPEEEAAQAEADAAAAAQALQEAQKLAQQLADKAAAARAAAVTRPAPVLGSVPGAGIRAS